MRQRSSGHHFLRLVFYIVSLLVLCVLLSLLWREGIRRSTSSLEAEPLSAVKELMSSLAGGTEPRTTLLVLANHYEQRTGGGFVGTAGLVEGESGHLRLVSVRSIYYYDHRVENKGGFSDLPAYLSNLTVKMSARDSLNDIRTPDNIAEFRNLFGRESGVYADNVVIITPEVLRKALEYVGPITLDAYKIIVTQDNILEVLQREVEAGQDKQDGKDPKTVLSVLAQQLVSRLTELDVRNLASLTREIPTLMGDKQVYAQVVDTKVQAQLDRWQGSLAPIGSMNSILVTAANHVANKSSAAIEQKTDATLSIDQDGQATLDLIINRNHTSDYSGLYVDPRSGNSEWLIGDNLSWVQVALPKGSDVQGKNWQSVSDERATVVGQDVLVKPLQSTEIGLTAKLPGKYVLSAGQPLVVNQNWLAQFGWFGQDLSVTIVPPPGYRLSSGEGELLPGGQGVHFATHQLTDRLISYVFTKS